MFDGNNINVFIAFGAGILTFFASCLLPLAPSYLLFLTGLSINDLQKPSAKTQRQIIITNLLFSLGFATVFLTLGLSLNLLKSWLISYKEQINFVSGLLFILFGLNMLGVLKLKIIQKNFRLKLPKLNNQFRFLNAFLAGAVFALSWSPCIGPVLAVILYWAGSQETFLLGFSMLLAYTVGVTLPFLVLGILFTMLANKLKLVARYSNTIEKVSAIIVIAFGILFLTNKFSSLTLFITHILDLSKLAR